MPPFTVTSPLQVASRHTASLTDTRVLAPDPFALLDHRIRAGAVLRAQALPGHYLGVADAEGIERLIPVSAAITHVGRAMAAGLRIEHFHVSRRHAIILREDDEVRVLDDRSSAGTLVNGDRVLARELRDGDVISLGPVRLTYRRIR